MGIRPTRAGSTRPAAPQNTRMLPDGDRDVLGYAAVRTSHPTEGSGVSYSPLLATVSSHVWKRRADDGRLQARFETFILQHCQHEAGTEPRTWPAKTSAQCEWERSRQRSTGTRPVLTIELLRTLRGVRNARRVRRDVRVPISDEVRARTRLSRRDSNLATPVSQCER